MAAPASDDEELTLSSSTLSALQSFYAERDAHADKFAKLQQAAEEQHAGDTSGPLTMEAFTEDWNESQFWYSDETATLLAKQLLDGAAADMTVVVISVPSVFVALKNLVAAQDIKPRLVLLEHDNRFSVFPEFVFYDFAQPVKLPGDLKGAADHIICDPPFLSEDCQTKAALTVRWLAKTHAAEAVDAQGPAHKLIVCTGERMAPLVTKLYRSLGLKTTDFEPVHARGLSNEFYCYANFECESWKWRQADASSTS